MILELHECCTTLTHYAKGLRSVGIETNTLTIGCFEAHRERLPRALIALIVPRPDRDSPSSHLAGALSQLESIPVIAMLNERQYTRPQEWLSSGVHVLIRSRGAIALLAYQVRALNGFCRDLTPSPDFDLPLTRIERRILELISSRPGKPFTRSAILRHIYNDHRIVCPRTVDAHVKNLRRKLPNPRVVRSVYGEGYSFERECGVI